VLRLEPAPGKRQPTCQGSHAGDDLAIVGGFRRDAPQIVHV